MGPTGDQHIARAGCVAMQTQGSETAECRDREQPLLSFGAVTSQQNAAVLPQGGTDALIHPVHPVPTGVAWGDQGHGDSIDVDGTTGGQVGQVGGNGAPAHIHGRCGGIAEMDAIHQNVGVDQQWPGVGGQGCGVVTELIGRSEASQPPEQLRFSQLRQGRAHAWALSCSAPSTTFTAVIRSSTPNSSRTSNPSTT